MFRQLEKSWSILVLCLTTAITLQAGTITLSATDSGWYQSDGTAGASNNQNYIAGTSGTGTGLEFRDFFAFDLSSVTQTIISAQLQAYNPSAAVAGDTSNGYTSPNASDTYNLFDVSTSLAALSGRTGGVGAFNDLGGGTVYGTHVFTTADNGTIVSIPLNAAAIAALNLSYGLFAFGGADVTVVLGGPRDNVFAFTAGPAGGSIVSNTTRQLVLQTAAVPEPATLLPAGLSMLGLVVSAMRRRRTSRHVTASVTGRA